MNEPRWRRYLRFHRQDSTADLDDELRDHLQSTIDSLVARGMSLEDARAEASRRFGDVGAVRSRVGVIDARHDRAMRFTTYIDTVKADIVYALRQLVRAPVVTAVTAISIGLGVALNVTVFSIANGLILRPLPGARTSWRRA
jgi:putative ABC transport system permease protein